MSNLKHVVHRRVHLERAQPGNRKKYGLLEKHRDYVERAKDYHQKEKAIRYLEEKVKTKNENEFNYKMVSSSIDGNSGKVCLNKKSFLCSVRNKKVHGNRKEKSKTEMKKLQLDASVLAYRSSVTNKKLEELLKSNSGGFSETITDNRKNLPTHILIEDNESENNTFTRKEKLDFLSNKRKKAPVDMNNEKEKQKNVKMMKKNLEFLALDENINDTVLATYREMKDQLDNSKKLNSLLQRIQTEKDLISKGKKKKVSEIGTGHNKIVCYKWFGERKK